MALALGEIAERLTLPNTFQGSAAILRDAREASFAYVRADMMFAALLCANCNDLCG